MSSFYPPNVLPRVELKYKAKGLLRGNWMLVIAVTLLYVLLTGFKITYNYSSSSEGPLLGAGQDYGTWEIGQIYFHYSLSSLGSAIGNIGVENLIFGVLLALVSALLIDGVLTYCYSAWFVTLTEIGDSRRLTFDDFVSQFGSAVTAVLAFLWQQLWIIIWSLLSIPGFVLLIFAALSYMTQGASSSMMDVINGSTAFALVSGSLLYIASMVVVYIITLRYQFIFQIIADGRGKVGPRQALRYSCAITKGHLKELFVLDLSFIPWYIASVFTFGIAYFYLLPYRTTTMALSYRWLRDQAFQDGRLDPAALGYVKAGGTAAAAESESFSETIDI